MNIDPISDYLTCIRNASNAGHRIVSIPSSKMKKEITKILFYQGYISGYKFEDEIKPISKIKIYLKYDLITKNPIIRSLKRVSKSGLRKYCGSDNLPSVLNGLGLAIISTSKGIMTNKEAKKINIGGEIICYVY
ncbi:MAG TPA: 30S ribosomal protein S8 [Candidatus Angelobacter sp.]|jgi:small subunit ribosomal protein S8|nr:30S ribosomal protein S8 [Candidatus Angelobacter sp.]